MSKESAFILVPTGEIASLREAVDSLKTLLAERPTQTDSRTQEPGPHSRRKFFRARELQERWEMSKSKFAEISREELPVWKMGEANRYFWAYVWAYEGRISRNMADEIWNGTMARIHALPKTA